MMLEKWRAWIDKQSLSKNTVALYSRKLPALIEYFESRMRKFKIDSLFYPLECEVLFPSIDGYLEDAKTVGDKNVALKTYRYMTIMVHQEFTKRYASDKTYPIEKKTAFEMGLRARLEMASKRIKQYNTELTIVRTRHPFHTTHGSETITLVYHAIRNYS